MKKLLFSLVLLLIVMAGCGNQTENNDSQDGQSDNNSTNEQATDDKAKEQEAEELKKVTLVLDWTPNTNHTGLYVAQAKGYFEEQGLDVEITLPGQSGADQVVASGEAEFGISAQESITQARIQDIPIVSIAAIIQHNTSGFASPVEKGIESPADYVGKTYGGWGAPVEAAVIDSLMKQEGASVEDVNIVNMGNADFFTAVKRDIDFAWIYYGWTGVEAELRDVELNVQFLTDYSDKLDYYTPVITTNETMISENPDTIKAFLAAVSNGYQYAIENPEAAADILIEAVPDLDTELVKASQKWLSPKYQDDAAQWGVQKQQVWENYADWMYDNGLLESKLDAAKAFTNEFLPKK